MVSFETKRFVNCSRLISINKEKGPTKKKRSAYKDGIPGFPAEENPWPIFLLAIYLALCLRIIQRKRRKIVESFVFALCSSPASKQTQTRHERKKGKNKSFCRSFTDSSRRKILSIRWCSEGGEVATLVTPGDLFHLLLKRRPVMARWSTALNFGRFRSNSELTRVKDCTRTSKVRPIKVLFFYPTFQRLKNTTQVPPGGPSFNWIFSTILTFISFRKQKSLTKISWKKNEMDRHQGRPIRPEYTSRLWHLS